MSTNFLEHTQEVVVLQRATPSHLGALAPSVANARCRLEREPSALGVKLKMASSLMNLGGQSLKESLGINGRGVRAFNGLGELVCWLLKSEYPS